MTDRVRQSLSEQGIEACWIEITDNTLENVVRMFARLDGQLQAIVGLGGGKALDVAKYLGSLARLPYFSVPTSLSNDGFCSPQSSLTVEGRRKSVPAAVPFGVVVDTAICRDAPRALTLSGVGDLMAKFTAANDWKRAFHATGEPINDFAVLLSDSSIHAFLNHPTFDLDGVRLLATALLQNGLAMEMCSSSRPASGAEHLISHALDDTSARPRLHGLQVGVATYLVSVLQENHTESIAAAFSATGFWDAIAADPFSRREWLRAVEIAPTIKPGYYTVLSARDVLPEVTRLLTNDANLARCFVE
jgi:glycerol-1-phosphate dehydrogenase [NAD(P)+]